MDKIQQLFSRPIDRRIEKVIDYYASDEERLEQEIREYEVTPNVEQCFRKFLDHFDAGVRAHDVTEVGIWVYGYYGSGKSSFTKYLGFALEGEARIVKGRQFREYLAERLDDAALKATLSSLVAQQRIAVVLLDLAAQQLADLADAPVSTVLYYQVLRTCQYSREKKLAALELSLEAQGRYDEFQAAYREKFKGEWKHIHNEAMRATGRAATLVPHFFPDEYPSAQSFLAARWEEVVDTREQAQQMIDLIKKETGCEAILFLVDEAGQYVAPKGSLILNLDGLVRNFKELGQGKVWMVATGQQTLQEVVEKAAYNSAELNKLRDRFPIAIGLEATDIREITRRRLLTKSKDATEQLRDLFHQHGQAALNHTRLRGTKLFKGDPSAEEFGRLYPFLPQHFDLLLELIRVLARSTGGVGLRSAIRVIQDLLIDSSRTLPPGKQPIAAREVGALAGIDDFYDTLRHDIKKVLPHVELAVARVDRIFSSGSDRDRLIRRVARAIGALQPLDPFPRTAQNLAALLYPGLGAPSLLSEVQLALEDLLIQKETGVVNDPQSGGHLFLSDEIRPLRDKRNAYKVSGAEVSSLRDVLLRTIFDPAPFIMLEGVKKVQAGIQYGSANILAGDVLFFRIEAVEADRFETRRSELLVETNASPELRKTIIWLITYSGEIDDLLSEAVRSQIILREAVDQTEKAVAQFLRSEDRLKAQNLERATRELRKRLADGVLVSRGLPRAVGEAGSDLVSAAKAVLTDAASDLFPHLRLGAKKVPTEQAAAFLKVDRLDRISPDSDPLGFVGRRGGRATVDKNHPALSEALRAFSLKVEESGAGRLQGSQIQTLFSSPPYGWTKDTARYVFAGLLVAGEIQLHTPDGVLKTAGPRAAQAMKSTLSFNRIGVSLRDGRPSLEALDRAATRLEYMFASDVLPLEDHISRAVRSHIPGEIERIGSLPDRLRLLGLPGESRARGLLELYADLLKEDAGGATALLGAKDSSIAEDREWAWSILDCFQRAGEEDVKRATSLRESLDKLESLFPHLAQELRTPEDDAALRDVLESERFYERMGDLRGVMGRVFERLKHSFESHRHSWEQALRDLRQALEAQRGWMKISDEDRAALVARLKTSDLPELPRSGKELLDLQRLLVWEAGVSRLRDELLAELERRIPPPPELARGDTDDGQNPDLAWESPHIDHEEVVVEVVALEHGGSVRTGVPASGSPNDGQTKPTLPAPGETLAQQTLCSPAEVAVWLEDIRPRLETLVEAQAPLELILTRK